MMTLTIIFTCAATCLVLICIAPSSCWAAVAQTAQAQATVEAGAGGSETRFCEFYNETACSKNANNCYSLEECEPLDPEKRNHCFVLWHTDNATGASTIKLKGCFMDSKECYDREACIEESHRPKKDLMFCCCEGNMCNQNFTWSPSPTEAPAVIVGTQPETDVAFYKILLYAGLAVTILAAGALSLCFMYRRNKMNLFNELPTAEPSCPPSPEGLEEGGNLPIILREVRARGRFGAVWRAHLNQQEVAVKIFPVQDKQSWVSEQEIFKLPRMNHADILQYIGVEKRGDNLQAEYWLITAYHEKGSLCDYLKANTLTWAEAWRVAHTMSRGLTHLHDEVASSRAGARKPALAHRDFKSKNVLLKTDMSVCIADFGLALVFQPGKPCGDTHGQVGTRRYMAPEVLEGAINFTRDAFLRIDMYACGLVLWEIASRSQAWGTPGEYMLPLEEEVGAHPSLEEMQEAVVHNKTRPKIPELWRKHSGLTVMCDTMEECWDHDAEARLSASCVMERIGALTRMRRRSLPQHLPLLIENALPLTPTSASSILSNSNLNSNRDE